MPNLTREVLLGIIRSDLRGLQFWAAKKYLRKFLDDGLISENDIETLAAEGVFSDDQKKKAGGQPGCEIYEPQQNERANRL